MSKIVRYADGKKPVHGLLEGDSVYELLGDVYEGFERGPHAADLKDLKLLSPCKSTKIVGVGLNYRAVLEARGVETPEVPILFLKPPSSVIASGDSIILPEMSSEVVFEAELGVVIKRQAKHIPPDEVQAHVLGYTCANDVSAVDLSLHDPTVFRAKSFDTFCPLGPCIATDLDISDLEIRSNLNGQLRQEGSIKDMVFSVSELVSFISKIMTLEPGDVILTGTPPGAGTLSAGDEFEVEIVGIGTLSNGVLAES
jgi:2-keto-4-pentenoate hydratase/2-oxohepta-3-ene-1,7-dioic acid hydratase in catechol pathway